MRRVLYPFIGLVAVTSFLLGVLASGARGGRMQVLPQQVSSTPPVVITRAATDTAPVATSSAVAGVDFASVAARMNAAIVNVDTAVRDLMPETPRRWQRENDDRGGPREGSGSGFVIDPAGFILTNHHVIDGADRVTVTLSDGRAFRATVIGADPAIDVALLKVNSPSPLVAAPLGRSDRLRVGEWVCAIGNPLGYVHSVTVGVVSFMGRKLFDLSLDEFIQTDAAISFGNSGGPLINARGEVVGITTAVSVQASNIGFAIPIDQVMNVLPQLRDTGRVSRGFIGVVLTNVTRPLAEALRLGTSRGALIQDVAPSTPADRAGLRPYDVIAAVDGQPVHSDDELIRTVAARAPGTMAVLEVWRDGASRSVSVKLTERPLAQPTRASRVRADARPVAEPDGGLLGLSVQLLDSAAIRRLGVPANVTGVLISDIDATGPAREARLRRGQIVMEINRRPVTTPQAFAAATASLRPGDAIALLLYDPLNDQRVIVSLTIDPTS
jgi:serine protease Do